MKEFYIVALQMRSDRNGSEHWFDVDLYGAFAKKDEAFEWAGREAREEVKEDKNWRESNRFIVQAVTAVQKIKVENP